MQAGVTEPYGKSFTLYHTSITTFLYLEQKLSHIHHIKRTFREYLCFLSFFVSLEGVSDTRMATRWQQEYERVRPLR